MKIGSTLRRTPPADALLAAAFAAITQIEVWVFAANDTHSIAVRIATSVLVLIASAALGWRRSLPVRSFWVNSIAVVLAIAVGFDTDIYQWTNLVALYSIAAHAPRRQSWFALPAALGGVGFYFLRFPFDGGLIVYAFSSAVWLVGWLVGRGYGASIAKTKLRAERDLSQQLAETHQQRLQLEESRARIAREVHDIIGHTVNVMVVHAGAGRGAVDSDPQAAKRAFEVIEETGRVALTELDTVLALLSHQSEGSDLQPLPGIGDIPGLGRLYEDSRFDVTVNLVGESGLVPPTVGLAAYRIVQEALTNAVRHAGAASAVVDVRIGDGAVRLSVHDDGVGLQHPVGGGRGLTGMKERAAMHDGEIHVANHDEGGLVVTGHLRWEPA